jgi:tetratricopeptide (TPR) repeat protein
MNWRLSSSKAAPQITEHPPSSTPVLERINLLSRYGLQQLAQQHYAEAVASFSRAVKIQPDRAKLWYYRGDALANLGRYREALSSFEQALRLNPNSHEAWIFRAVMLIHLQRYGEAVDSCDRALELRPNDREALVFRGAALSHLGQYRRAYTSYGQATAKQRLSLWKRLQRFFLKLVD